MRVYGLLMAAATVVAPVFASNSTLPEVELDYTTVRAIAGNTTVGYYKYQNIRYAAVPTGDLRFAAPQWPEIEDEVNTGTNLAADGVTCETSEDCLYMDVWAPADAVGRSLPVLVWTYGGGFTGGSKDDATPEGLFDLSTDFIFVGYNYRLGLAGLATGPTYQHEGGTSNPCVWDSTHAFKWVQKYISKFGGDPDDVTAAGFSAGGSQVLFQMTRFGGNAEQLFHKAYITSPGYVPGAGHHHGEMFWQNVSSAVGCNGGHLDCMRQVDFDALNEATTDAVNEYTYQLQPRVDGFIVPDTYEAELYKGHFNFSGPCVITHEQHEENTQAYTGVDTEDDIRTELRVFFPAITDDVIEELLELYPEADYTSAGLRFADMKQSFDLTGKDLALTNALKNETWNAEVAIGAATHGTDQGYYWYNTYTLDTSGSSSSSSSESSDASSSSSSTTGEIAMSRPTISDPTLAVVMQKYFLSFVLTGNPNTMWPDDKIYWPQHGNDTGVQIVFNETVTLAEDDLSNSKSLFWNKAMWY